MVKKKVDDDEEMMFKFRAHRDNNGGEGDDGNSNGNGRRQCKSRGMEKAITIFRQIYGWVMINVFLKLSGYHAVS